MGGGRTRALLVFILSFLEEDYSSEEEVAESGSCDDEEKDVEETEESIIEEFRICRGPEQDSMNSTVIERSLIPTR